MTGTHLHLLLNHIPILGSIFGLCLLGYGLVRKNVSLRQAGLVTLVLVALLCIPAFLTGEEAEETVEHLPGVSESIIEQHEELAVIGLWLMIGTGVVSLFSLIADWRKNSRAYIVAILALVLSLATFGVMAKVGNLGGQIRHTEIRDAASGGTYAPDSGAEEEDDD